MERLKQRILKDGSVIEPDIVKVDSFLNHQIDVSLLDEIGGAFYERFCREGITKILTVEASGIAVACAAARFFNVPVVFAKKHDNKNMDNSVYEELIHSFTKDKDYIIKVAKRYLQDSDKVLIIDDFLANGEAARGLVQMVIQAGAEVCGIGIVIEKGFQHGGKKLREQGYRVESLTIVESINEKEIVFK